MYMFTEWSDVEPGVAPIPSDYLLNFWTPVVGPSSVLILRVLGLRLRISDPWKVEPAELGQLFGLRGEGKQSPLVRSLARLEKFDFLRWRGDLGPDVAYEVRLTAPKLTPHQFDRLPSGLKVAYGMRRQAVTS